LGEPSNRSHPERNSVGLGLAIFCLLGVNPHRDRDVANVPDFIDSYRLGEQAAGSVIIGKRWEPFAHLRGSKSGAHHRRMADPPF
jgi:hypothetical protein